MSKKTERFTGKVRDGKFVPDDPYAFKGWFDDKSSHAVIVQLSTVGSEKTNPQNRYFHGVIVNRYLELMYDTGNETIVSTHNVNGFVFVSEIPRTFDICKTELKKMFAPVIEKIDKKTGELTHEPMSVAIMDKFQYSEFIDKCLRFIETTFDVKIQRPDETD